MSSRKRMLSLSLSTRQLAQIQLHLSQLQTNGHTSPIQSTENNTADDERDGTVLNTKLPQFDFSSTFHRRTAFKGTPLRSSAYEAQEPPNDYLNSPPTISFDVSPPTVPAFKFSLNDSQNHVPFSLEKSSSECESVPNEHSISEKKTEQNTNTNQNQIQNQIQIQTLTPLKRSAKRNIILFLMIAFICLILLRGRFFPHLSLKTTLRRIWPEKYDSITAALKRTIRITKGKESNPKDKLYNYASSSCGARIVGAQRKVLHANALLNTNRDHYLLAPCDHSNSTFFIEIELCQGLLVDSIELSNFELFSSTVRDFVLYGTLDVNITSLGNANPNTVNVNDTNNKNSVWTLLLNGTAIVTRNPQFFNVNKPTWAKFLRLEVHSHYGTSEICTLSHFSAFGKTVFEDLQESEIDDYSPDVTYPPSSAASLYPSFTPLFDRQNAFSSASTSPYLFPVGFSDSQMSYDYSVLMNQFPQKQARTPACPLMDEKGNFIIWGTHSCVENATNPFLKTTENGYFTPVQTKKGYNSPPDMFKNLLKRVNIMERFINQNSLLLQSHGDQIESTHHQITSVLSERLSEFEKYQDKFMKIILDRERDIELLFQFISLLYCFVAVLFVILFIVLCVVCCRMKPKDNKRQITPSVFTPSNSKPIQTQIINRFIPEKAEKFTSKNNQSNQLFSTLRQRRRKVEKGSKHNL